MSEQLGTGHAVDALEGAVDRLEQGELSLDDAAQLATRTADVAADAAAALEAAARLAARDDLAQTSLL
ncbi:MAG: exodeoxyribonuclease VII small subunit [Patulibacter minatonensis]